MSVKLFIIIATVRPFVILAVDVDSLMHMYYLTFLFQPSLAKLKCFALLIINHELYHTIISNSIRDILSHDKLSFLLGFIRQA